MQSDAMHTIRTARYMRKASKENNHPNNIDARTTMGALKIIEKYDTRIMTFRRYCDNRFKHDNLNNQHNHLYNFDDRNNHDNRTHLGTRNNHYIIETTTPIETTTIIETTMVDSQCDNRKTNTILESTNIGTSKHPRQSKQLTRSSM